MPQLLETIMLICFGISWPISLYKNVKAQTAAGTSVVFMLMIIVGYLAGITAKLMTGASPLVLAVYLLNLAMVSANLGVYFRNRALDRRRAEGVAVPAGGRAVVA